MTTPTRIPIPTGAPPAATAPPRLDGRLGAALPYIRGGVMADVGTDHAYLPIRLLLEGRCSFTVASDIHRGPAEIAAAHLASYGIRDDRAAVLLTDGLHGCEVFEPRDVCIFGMGGEMIARIIDEAPWVRHPSIRLILQPMTRMETLRDYLNQNGFGVIDECMVQTDRIYQILCVEYDGQRRTHTPLELLLGEKNMMRRDELTLSFARRQADILQKSREGKQRASHADTSYEDMMLTQLCDFLSYKR